MFILLIFFMLNSQWDRDSALNLRLPQAGQATPLFSDHIEILLDELDGISIEGNPTSLIEMEGWLKGQSTTRPVLIKADRDASYGKAIQIFDLLQKLGFNTVSLGALPPRL